MSSKIKNIVYFILISMVIIMITIYGYITSDFSKIKKFTGTSTHTNLKTKIAKKRYYSTDVNIENDGVLHLGDFEINIASDKKLVANISLKYTIPKDVWQNSKAKNEMLDNGPVIRNIIIETILNKESNNIINYRVKNEIINNINPFLTHTKIEAIYFNEFIVSD